MHRLGGRSSGVGSALFAGQSGRGPPPGLGGLTPAHLARRERFKTTGHLLGILVLVLLVVRQWAKFPQRYEALQVEWEFLEQGACVHRLHAVTLPSPPTDSVPVGPFCWLRESCH